MGGETSRARLRLLRRAPISRSTVRADATVARRIGETRSEPAIDELRDAFGDVSEHCERLPASEAEIGDTFEGLLQFGQDLLSEVEQRYAELTE